MKKKLTIGKLEVKSFVTSMDSQTSETVKGGIPAIMHSWKWCDPASNQYYCRESYRRGCIPMLPPEEPSEVDKF